MEPNGDHDTDSVADEDYSELTGVEVESVIIPEPTFNFDVPPGLPYTGETGDDIPEIDATSAPIVPPSARRERARKEPPPADEPPPIREPKTGPPGIDEWMDFFSRVALRVICDWYISWAFAGVDEDLLSEREVERLKLTPDERNRVARPFAELSYKSKIMRKHGRMIVASGGAFDALVTLGAWFSRVSRIARKYKTPNQGKTRDNERTRQATPNPTGEYEGTNGGRVNGTYTIINPGG